MGFWDWLKGKPKGTEVVDKVWMNQEAKFRAICKEAQEQLLASPVLLVVAHFPATLGRLKVVFADGKLEHRCHERSLATADFLREISGRNGAPLLLAQADALVPDEFPNPLVEELPPLIILIAERHFLRVKDDRVVDFARGLGRRCRLTFHVSLEDPLMRMFAGEWVAQTLRKLGATDSAPIESAMVGRRIQAAQTQLAKRVVEERQAESAEEWLQWNVPG